MLCRGALFRKRPGKHELGFEDGCLLLHEAIERRAHPVELRVPHELLNVFEPTARLALEPAPVKLFGKEAELDHEVRREVLGFNLTALLAPEPNKGSLISTH